MARDSAVSGSPRSRLGQSPERSPLAPGAGLGSFPGFPILVYCFLMESPETYPVKKAGELIGKAPNTVRTWSGEEYFGPYLSSYANPEPGGERRYTERDIRILRTASILQKRGLKIREIIPRIASGELIEDLPEEDSLEPEPERRSQTQGSSPNLPARLDLSNQIELFLRPYESQISRLSADLEREREEIEREREARITAEKELSRLSALIEERSNPKEREDLEREREARLAAEKELSRLSALLEERSIPKEEPEKGREEIEREREARLAAEKELSRLSALLEERSLPWYKRLFGDG